MQNHSAIVVAVTCAASLASIVPATSHAQLSSQFQVYASGFNGPRGLKFGRDGQLYVGEASTAPTRSNT